MNQKNYPPELRRIASKNSAVEVGFHKTGTPYIKFEPDNSSTQFSNSDLKNYEIRSVFFGVTSNRVSFKKVR